ESFLLGEGLSGEESAVCYCSLVEGSELAVAFCNLCFLGVRSWLEGSLPQGAAPSGWLSAEQAPQLDALVQDFRLAWEGCRQDALGTELAAGVVQPLLARVTG